MGGRDLGTGVPELYRCASLEVEDEKEHQRSPPPSSTGTRLSRPRSSRTAAARRAASAHPTGGGPPCGPVPGAPSSRCRWGSGEIEDEAAAAALDGKGGKRRSGLTHMGLEIPVFVLQTRQGGQGLLQSGQRDHALGDPRRRRAASLVIRDGGGVWHPWGFTAVAACGVPGDSRRRRWCAAIWVGIVEGRAGTNKNLTKK